MDGKIILALMENGQYSDSMQTALSLFADGQLSPLILKKKAKEQGFSLENLRWEAVDVIIDYAEMVLSDNVLTKDEMDTLRMMKLFFKVREGDFLRQHKDIAIENILCHQLERIYQDNKVDKEEALMKVDLQELFGLSYDQFLTFERKAVEQALKNGANIDNLDTYYSPLIGKAKKVEW